MRRALPVAVQPDADAIVDHATAQLHLVARLRTAAQRATIQQIDPWPALAQQHRVAQHDAVIERELQPRAIIAATAERTATGRAEAAPSTGTARTTRSTAGRRTIGRPHAIGRRARRRTKAIRPAKAAGRPHRRRIIGPVAVDQDRILLGIGTTVGRALCGLPIATLCLWRRHLRLIALRRRPPPWRHEAGRRLGPLGLAQ